MLSIKICDMLRVRIYDKEGVWIDSPVLWRTRRRLRKWYFQKRYAKKLPGLYYDHLYQTYVLSVRPDLENWDLTLLCCDLAGVDPLYQYRLGGAEMDNMTLEGVLREAYDHAGEFSIPEEYRNQYSAQELRLLEKLVERGRRDRSEWTG